MFFLFSDCYTDLQIVTDVFPRETVSITASNRIRAYIRESGN